MAEIHGENVTTRQEAAEAEAALGWRVGVWWGGDEKFYYGVIKAYNKEDNTHQILYEDNEEMWYELSNERVVWMGKVEGQGTNVVSPKGVKRQRESDSSPRLTSTSSSSSSPTSNLSLRADGTLKGSARKHGDVVWAKPLDGSPWWPSQIIAAEYTGKSDLGDLTVDWKEHVEKVVGEKVSEGREGNKTARNWPYIVRFYGEDSVTWEFVTDKGTTPWNTPLRLEAAKREMTKLEKNKDPMLREYVRAFRQAQSVYNSHKGKRKGNPKTKPFDILDYTKVKGRGSSHSSSTKEAKTKKTPSEVVRKVATDLSLSELWNSSNSKLREEVFVKPPSFKKVATDTGTGSGEESKKKRIKMKKVSTLVREGVKEKRDGSPYDGGGEIDFNLGLQLQPIEDDMPISVSGLANQMDHGVVQRRNSSSNNKKQQSTKGGLLVLSDEDRLEMKKEMKEVYTVLGVKKPTSVDVHNLMQSLKSLDGRKAFTKEISVSGNLSLVSSEIGRLSILNGWINEYVDERQCEDFVCNLCKLIFKLNLDLQQIKESSLGKTMKLKLRKHKSAKITKQASVVIHSWNEKAKQVLKLKDKVAARTSGKQLVSKDSTVKAKDALPEANHDRCKNKNKNEKKEAEEEDTKVNRKGKAEIQGSTCGQLSHLLRGTIEDKKLLESLRTLGQPSNQLGEQSVHLADLMLRLVKELG